MEVAALRGAVREAPLPWGEGVVIKTTGADRESRCYPLQGKAPRIRTRDPKPGVPVQRTPSPDPASARWLIKAPFQP